MASSRSPSNELDLTKSTLDLTTALLNTSNSSNPLVNGAIEVGQWLGRERLNRFELADCLSKAKGIIYPNEAGLQFCEEVKGNGLQSPIPHIFLMQSGSLGRMVVRDPWLCWIVSTTAALFQFHNTSSFISKALTNLILHQHYSQEDMNYDFRAPDRPERVQVESVMEKIVLSVWLNVVNAGHNTINLPEELRSVCPNGHLLNSYNLGRAMHTLQRAKKRVIFQSEHLIANITLWLMLHHDGILRVVISSHTVYEKRLGSAEKEIEVRVQRYCAEDCRSGRNFPDYVILADMNGEQQNQTTGTYDQPSARIPLSPAVRRSLYDIPRSYPMDSRANKPSVQVLIKGTTQKLLRWLLNVPLVMPKGLARIVFQPLLGETCRIPVMTISGLLQRVPSLINFNWEHNVKSSVVYKGAEDEMIPSGILDPMDSNLTDSENIIEKTWYLEEMLPYFPIVQDLMFEVRALCLCPDCQSKNPEIPLQPGCLCRIAFDEMMHLLGHGIADGFGCDDVSGIREADDIVTAVFTASL